MFGMRKVYTPDKRRWRPQKVKFRDELSGVIFKSTIPRVKKAFNRATALLLETNFVSLEELYSLLGISDAVKLFSPNLDLDYSELNNVLGWDILVTRSVDYELIPVIENEELIIKIVFSDIPEFWDITGYLHPANNIDHDWSVDKMSNKDLYDNIECWNLPQKFLSFWPYHCLQLRSDIGKLLY